MRWFPIIFNKIYKKYSENKDISWINSFYAFRWTLASIEIIRQAKWRDILYDYSEIPVWAFWKPWWKYSWEIDENFSWDDFWNSIFDFTYKDFLEKNKDILIDDLEYLQKY